ncbi:hypothetical protein GCM10025882_32050 [Acinetobacter gyllenbergii]|uniref:Uncharacterized protein n=1 Tax=Acinetobacter gyllenbergii CIP 110306 = MTCC 11365 TaxID=1217657 RepID=A0A829HDA0_9GAMM|nr:hypothetical protein [Acinetobacter gyllenbergii]EPF72579.1 hypothetical protein F957_03715 [Acinetobacter gyllenbergii CIP 110306 = MTCC 11365]EPH31101.1 hypothetical protein L293_2504 [Acinetobacter gyllenbergii CIP 110306 = MTCC 11365]GMA12780.1 hypothetical protein GCM10025882_32050 [Acinetobacter gyllenbergii]
MNTRLPDYKQIQAIQSWYEPALDLLNKLLERNKANLRRRGYTEENAAITREEFRQQLAHLGRISLHTAGEIETSLYNARKIEYMGGYVRPKVGES